MNAQDLIDSVGVQPEMIAANPCCIRKNYVVTLLRNIAKAIDRKEIVSFSTFTWDGEATCSVTVTFADPQAVEQVVLDLTDPSGS